MMDKEKLEYFKKKLLKERQMHQEELRKMREEYFDTDELSRLDKMQPAHAFDAAVLSSEQEKNIFLIEKVQKIIFDIDIALKKIEEGRYGICEGCGKNIDEERLKVLPYAVYCLECQKSISQE